MKKTETNIDLNSLNFLENPVTEHLVTDKDILIFAKQILFFIFLAFLACAFLGAFFKVQVFYEIIKMGILPAFSSVMTYYFVKDKG